MGDHWLIPMGADRESCGGEPHGWPGVTDGSPVLHFDRSLYLLYQRALHPLHGKDNSASGACRLVFTSVASCVSPWRREVVFAFKKTVNI